MLSKKAIVCKSNVIIEASYRLTLNEQRVILACISQIDSRKLLLPSESFKLTVKEFSYLYSVSPKAAYLALSDSAKVLAERKLFVDDSEKKTCRAIKWIESISYCPIESKIDLIFSAEISSYLSGIKKTFTSYRIQNIEKMTSIYGIRLYELLMQWTSIGKREIELEWLKEKFDISNQYKKICNFKKRVLDPAIKEVNKHSNLYVLCRQRKSGRRVTNLTFIFDKREVEDTQYMENKTPPSKLIGFLPESDPVFSSVEKLILLVPSGYQKIKSIVFLIIKYIKMKDFEYVERNLMYTNKKSTGSYKGYLNKSLENDWALDWETEKNTPKVKYVPLWERAGFESEEQYHRIRFEENLVLYRKSHPDTHL